MVPFKRRANDDAGEEVFEVSVNGEMLLDYPLLNKGSAFSEEERREFELLGLLPPHVSSMEDQVSRTYENYRKNDSDLGRYLFLTGLQDRNETLFYRLVQEHIREMLPVIYTPVVGVASQSYSHIYRRPRGLYISYPDRGHIEALLANSPRSEVDAIVVTDGERILGLGDLGVGGMGIPIGKLSLYTLCAGIRPAATLPIFLDAGTGNNELLEDPLYLGWRHERVRGQEYDGFIEGFVQAVKQRFPGVLLQWEDFSRANARRLLDRYRDELCSFNDDIQGTGAVTLAALLAAVRVAGARLRDQHIAVLGAGSAATGVCDMITAAMVDEGLSDSDARSRLWLVDVDGLLHSQRGGLESFNEVYAQPTGRIVDWKVVNRVKIGLFDVVRNVRPNVLIGLSGQAGAFSEPVVTEMAKHAGRPIIFPLSNPTALSEASPSDLLAWTGGRAIVATGSPFPDVSYNGQTIRITQCNNVYIFPGVGLGLITSRARRATDGTFMAAARTLAELSPALGDPTSPLFPDIEAIRDVSRRVAISVGLEAQQSGTAPGLPSGEWEQMVEAAMWRPRYARYLRSPLPGDEAG